MHNRRENRFQANQDVTVRVLGLGSGPILQASVLDISASGMRLRTTLPVPSGTPVEIEVARTIAQGVIGRCESTQDSYEVVVQVYAVTAKQPPVPTS
jgi:hypothetical protein